MALMSLYTCLTMGFGLSPRVHFAFVYILKLGYRALAGWFSGWASTYEVMDF